MKTVIIIIPVHKEEPTHAEAASFKRCLGIFKDHPITVLAPKGLSLKKYKVLEREFQEKYIDPKWLASKEQYNKLKISRFFYQLFSEYNFLLTYELDAWVFRDEIVSWLRKDYDFIGAPWFAGYDNANSTTFIEGANSGFSLRKIKSTRRVLKRIDTLKRLRQFWFKSRLQSFFSFYRFLVLFKRSFRIKAISLIDKLLLDHWNLNEDYFLTAIVPAVFSDYKIAPKKEAIPFSFEVNPSMLFEVNENKLPFGCHAWQRYEPDFWEKFIHAEDYIQ